MKIVFTGGGTGGHFYPIVAVVEKINQIADTENIIPPRLYYFSDTPYDREVLFENGVIFEEIRSGKMRVGLNASNLFLNFLDLFKIFFGTLNAIYKLFSIYPDVVFGKGGYASFPTLLAARILGIPVIIHESDSRPGRVNKWAGKFALKIAVSFREAGEYFPKDKVAWIGQPIRAELELSAPKKDALSYFKFESGTPVVFIIGGSQGAELLNNTVLDALPRMLSSYQVIHQTGVLNYKNTKERADVILLDNKDIAKYVPIAFLNPLAMKMAAGAADIVVSRAGSGLFEIASWGIPSILVPIEKTNDDHQKTNAFSYAREEACSVIEEENLTGNILLAEIERILGDKTEYEHMAKAARNFGKTGAANKIARELIETALSHEK